MANPINELLMTMTRRGPLALIGLSIFLIAFTAALVPNELFRGVIIGGAILIIIAASTVEMYVYLQSERSSFSPYSTTVDPKTAVEIKRLERQVEALRGYVDKLPNQPIDDLFSNDEKAKIQKDVISKLGERTVSDLAKKLLETKAKLDTLEAHVDNVRALASHMLERLEEEVSNLGRRANINLLIGIGVSFIGVAVLVWFVFSVRREDIVEESHHVLAFYIASRLSLVVFIQVFAYFFLRLYRYGIFEIKYFQNEITNAEFRLIALETAFRSGDADAMKKASAEMLKIERNFILKKGETTLALKRDEIEQEHDKSVISILERFLAVKPADKAKSASS
jgi:hypothetical protein